MTADEKPVPSVWTRPRRSREQPALSRAQIVAEAVRLLDAEGIEALSMRRLGTRLDSAATSLYRHVANKDELVELVVDEIYGEIPVPDVADPSDWRAAVTGCARGTRTVILRHPWMASLLGQVGLSYLGPNAMRFNDRLLALFEAAGFSLVESDRALNTVMAYVIGTGVSEAAWLTTLARTGQDERAWHERLRPAIEDAVRAYPRLSALSAAQGDRDPEAVRDEDFGRGLETVLAGVATRFGSEGH